MTPEMLKGEGHDLRLDIYCLGALMYEMLTGLPPHYSRAVNDMYHGIIENEVPFPPNLSKESISLMSKMLEKDPEKRFKNIEEIKEHEFFEEVEWQHYLDKLVEPEWKPNLVDSNFDPEYT